MLVYILIFWGTFRDVKIPSTAEFSSKYACEKTLEVLKQKGFDGICVSRSIG